MDTIKVKNIYKQYTKEVLEEMLKHPEEIETGCENDCDSCLSIEIQLIQFAINSKPVSP